MTIVSSIVAFDQAEADGRRWIRELHTDQVGRVYARDYLCPAAFDANAQLTADATQLWADIQAAEIAANVASVLALGSLASPTLVYTTAPANFAALRAAYATATQFQAIMAGDFLSSLTDVQLENAFGLTQSQVTTLRTNKLTPAATTAATIRAAAGQ